MIFALMLAAALGGLIISGWTFLHNREVVSGSFCDISATVNCDIVNRGPYSVIGGVPVALIGLVGYAFLLAAAFLWQRAPEDRALRMATIAAGLGGFAFSLYLTGLEALVIRAWCILCITSQILILVFVLLSLCAFRSTAPRAK